MIHSHLHSYLQDKKIPYNTTNFGVQINIKYYNYDTFKKFDNRLYFIDSTFVINY